MMDKNKSLPVFVRDNIKKKITCGDYEHMPCINLTLKYRHLVNRRHSIVPQTPNVLHNAGQL